MGCCQNMLLLQADLAHTSVLLLQILLLCFVFTLFDCSKVHLWPLNSQLLAPACRVALALTVKHGTPHFAACWRYGSASDPCQPMSVPQ